jgi:hypothetical protein
MVPSCSALTAVSIFIASIDSKVSPCRTFWPTSTTKLETIPGIGALTWFALSASAARALYATVEIDEEIPAEHFHAVAEVIGYVFRLKGKMPKAEPNMDPVSVDPTENVSMQEDNTKNQQNQI